MSDGSRVDVIEREETSEFLTLETAATTTSPESVALARMYVEANELM